MSKQIKEFLEEKQIDSLLVVNAATQDFIEQSNSISSGNNIEDDEDIIDLRALLGTLVDGKWLILLTTIIALVLGLAKAILDPPVFRLDALVQVKEASNSLGDLDPMQSLMEGNKTPVDTEIVIIKSRMILGEAVTNLNMEIIAEPNYFPYFGQAIARRFESANKDKISFPLFGHREYAWGGEEIKVKSLNVPTSWIGRAITLTAGKNGQFEVFDNQKLISIGKVGHFLEIPIKGEDTPLSLFVSVLKAMPGTQFTLSKQSQLNGINGLKRRVSVTEEEKTGILNFTMESTKPAFAMQTLNEIANIYVRTNVEYKSAEAQKTLLFLEKQLPIAKHQLEKSTTALNQYRLKKGSIDLNIETEGVLSGVVDLKTQLSLLKQQKLKLLSIFTEYHPTVITINKQVVELKKQLDVHNNVIETLPETQQVILRLTRDAEVDTQLYTALLNQLQTIKVTKAGTVGDVRVIDYAVLPSNPIKPKKGLIVGVALLLGLILGIGIVFLRKALQHGVENPAEIEKHLNIPVYATVPHSKFQQRLNRQLKKNEEGEDEMINLLAMQDDGDSAIESLRSLSTTLHFLFLDAKNNIVLISGPSPGIGKSFTSTNLAVVLANTGKKILLIDADMRKGSLSKTLGVSRETGLSDLISNSIEPAEAIKTIKNAGIDFISTGKIPPNPTALLLHERFEALLKQFSDQYDLIIIDSPPILAVTDASIIGRIAGATLMVIKAGEHSMGDLQLSVKRFKQNDVEIKGMILNDISMNSSAYGYNYAYEKYSY